MQKMLFQIPEPCQQNWDGMTPNSDGRFCNSCAKTVVDFSMMSDEALLNYFTKKTQDHVCGRVYPDQLNRMIESLPASRRKIFQYWQYVLSFFMFFGKAEVSTAQGTVKATTAKKSVIKNFDQTILGDISPGPEPVKKLKLQYHKIVIVDQDSVPIPFVNVKYPGTSKNSTGDEDGGVNINLNGSATILLSAVGYRPRSIVINELKANTIILQRDIHQLEAVEVEANMGKVKCTSILAGAMVISSHPTLKLKIKDSIKNIFSDSTLKIFPNPVQHGSTISLDIKLKKLGKYELRIINAGGQLLFNEQYFSAAKQVAQPVSIPYNWSAGTYFILLYTDQKKPSARAKLIIR